MRSKRDINRDWRDLGRRIDRIRAEQILSKTENQNKRKTK